MRPSVRSILFCLFVLGVQTAFSRLHAQSNSGSINGTVTDPSGAVIPGRLSPSKIPSAPIREPQRPIMPASSIFRTSRSTPTTLPSRRMALRHSRET